MNDTGNLQSDSDLPSTDNSSPALATVLYGINSRFTVSLNESIYECVIKGKILKGTGKTYAPLAPGDRVFVESDRSGAKQIVSRAERFSEFSRWNAKRKAPQTMAANLDLVVCVSSPVSPPFRPRFIDRIQVTCEIEKLPLLILLNKSDQGVSQDITERLGVYGETGCTVIQCSALTGNSMNEIKHEINGRRSVFIGQSGVGKTSLLNWLLPGPERQVGEISNKNNRGRHTTRFGTLLNNPAGGWIIDTPGIREFEIVDIDQIDLGFHFPDIAARREDCKMPTCTHDHEPGCAVQLAVKRGDIHIDRYESYLRILDSLRWREEQDGTS